jgi:acyl-CoA reductase-like NAD-dependent aldehyde dehydrogenase
VQAFDTRDEAIALANDIPYGLAASVWTTRLDDALALARGVEAGLVSVGAYSEGDLGCPSAGGSSRASEGWRVLPARSSSGRARRASGSPPALERSLGSFTGGFGVRTTIAA